MNSLLCTLPLALHLNMGSHIIGGQAKTRRQLTWTRFPCAHLTTVAVICFSTSQLHLLLLVRCHKNPATVAVCTMHVIALCSHTTNSASWIHS